jgi:hypothetical protein
MCSVHLAPPPSNTHVIAAATKIIIAPRTLEFDSPSVTAESLFAPEPDTVVEYTLKDLPESLQHVTAFVSDLPEFLRDAELEALVRGGAGAPPAVQIARSMSGGSLGYAFLVFRSAQDLELFLEGAERKLLQWSGGDPFLLKAKKMAPRGTPRAKVPIQLIDFVLGSTQTGERRSTKSGSNVGCPGRISGDDVVRLSRGQPAKVKGRGSRGVPHRLNEEEAKEFARSTAPARGYVRLEGTGCVRAKRAPRAKRAHRTCEQSERTERASERARKTLFGRPNWPSAAVQVAVTGRAGGWASGEKRESGEARKLSGGDPRSSRLPRFARKLSGGDPPILPAPACKAFVRGPQSSSPPPHKHPN